MAADLDRALDALQAIPADLPRDAWVRAGMAAQAAGLDFDAFDEWSAQAGNYDPAAALVEVLKALRTHPTVAWVERMNSGAAKVGGRFIRFGWPGCPDVLGQLRDGRLLGVEVKAQAGRLRPEQSLFLERIRGAGGVAFVARDLRDVLRELGRP